MKITRINLYQISMPLRTPFVTSFGRVDARQCLLLEAVAGDWIGYGECVADRDPGYSYETTGTAWHILQDFLIPAILGKEFSSPQEIQQHLAFARGHLMAKGSLEMVAWDLLGKQTGQSLQSMLGGRRSKVEVGVSVGLQANPDALVNTVAGYVEQGYTRIKIKIKPGRDLSDAEAVRRAFPTLRLQVDANSAYTLENALSLRPLDDLNLLLIEQPLAEDDIWDHSRLQPQIRTPLCLDESILTLRHARQALEMGACRIINIKAGRVGGLSQALAIHDHCYQQGVPVWCGGMLETGVGRAANLALASLPGFTLPGDISATDRYYAEDITEQRFSLNADSTITVPTAPGLGITINPHALARYTIRQTTLT